MITILLVLSVLVGVLLGKFFGQKQKFAKNLLILSAGFLITICLNEVFPEVYHENGSSMGIWVIAGVLLQMLLENLTKGFEHGHFHSHSDQAIVPFALVVGMFIHAFIEGIPLAETTDISSPYLMGILFHNLPISFILGAFIFGSKKYSASSWIVIVLFAAASPAGMFLGKYLNPEIQAVFLAIVGGIFLHISSVIIFESNKNHNVDWSKIGMVLLGIALAMIPHFFHVP